MTVAKNWSSRLGGNKKDEQKNETSAQAQAHTWYYGKETRAFFGARPCMSAAIRVRGAADYHYGTVHTRGGFPPDGIVNPSNPQTWVPETSRADPTRKLQW